MFEGWPLSALACCSSKSPPGRALFGEERNEQHQSPVQTAPMVWRIAIGKQSKDLSMVTGDGSYRNRVVYRVGSTTLDDGHNLPHDC